MARPLDWLPGFGLALSIIVGDVESVLVRPSLNTHSQYRLPSLTALPNLWIC